MGNPKTLGSYVQHINFMDQALEEPKGIRLAFADDSKAIRFRHMCYSARRMYNDANPGNPRWLNLVITLDKDSHTLVISEQATEILSVTDADGNPLFGYESPTLREMDETRRMELQAQEFRLRQPPTLYPDMDKLGYTRATRARPVLPDVEVILPDDFKPNETFKLGDLE